MAFAYKIGFSAHMPDRLYALDKPSGVFCEFNPIRMVNVPNMMEFEHQLHEMCKTWRLSKKEGFGVRVKNGGDPVEVMEACKEFGAFQKIVLAAFDLLRSAIPNQPEDSLNPILYRKKVTTKKQKQSTGLNLGNEEPSANPIKTNKDYSDTPAAIKKREQYATPEGKKKQAEYTARYKAKKLAAQRQVTVTI